MGIRGKIKEEGMRKLFSVLAVILPLVLGSSLAAQTADAVYGGPGQWYAGVGVAYNIERFTGDLESYYVEGGSEDADFDNTWGLGFKGGYFLTDFLAVEGLFQYHHEFEWSETLHWGGPFVQDVKGTATVKGYDFTVNGKVFLPPKVLPIPQLRPYAVLGLGYGRFKAEWDVKATGAVSATVYSESVTESGPFGRFGIGSDFFFNKNIGVEAEIAYNIGFGDLDNGRIIILSAGVVYLF